MIKKYRHSQVLTAIVAFLRGFGRFSQLSPVHPTVDGCVVVMHDELTDTTYRVHMDRIKSEVKVDKPLMFSDFLKNGGSKNEP